MKYYQTKLPITHTKQYLTKSQKQNTSASQNKYACCMLKQVHTRNGDRQMEDREVIPEWPPVYTGHMNTVSTGQASICFTVDETLVSITKNLGQPMSDKPCNPKHLYFAYYKNQI